MNEEVIYIKDYCLDIIPAKEETNESLTLYFDTKEELLAAEDSCAKLLYFLTYNIHVIEEYTDVFTLSQWNDGCGDYCELEEEECYE